MMRRLSVRGGYAQHDAEPVFSAPWSIFYNEEQHERATERPSFSRTGAPPRRRCTT
jgi:hypothetical protein